ncbi:hypothetical protein [Thermogutta sp.]|uniref:hypothetical protein n=1 Tax=Thermogutta sp. TaxID=1962930 RepID=UPI003C7B066D
MDFARNVTAFPVLQYTQIQPVKKMLGLWLEMTVEEAGRILNTDLSDFNWPDGQDAPLGLEEAESFTFRTFQCTRKLFKTAIGDQTRDNAEWDIINQHASIKARQAMTARTQAAVNRIFDTSLYPSTHVIDVNATFGAKWTAATSSNLVIRKSLNTAVQRIIDDTLGAVSAKDLVLVMSDTVARAIAESGEFADYLKGSPDALGALRYQFRDEDVAPKNFGLPRRLYGLEVIVDDTRKVTTKKGQTKSISPVLPSNMAAVIARPGALVVPYSPVAFSACTFYMFQEMNVETIQDSINKRTVVRVIENYACELTAPAAGVILTNVT